MFAANLANDSLIAFSCEYRHDDEDDDDEFEIERHGNVHPFVNAQNRHGFESDVDSLVDDLSDGGVKSELDKSMSEHKVNNFFRSFMKTETLSRSMRGAQRTKHPEEDEKENGQENTTKAGKIL